MKTSGEAKMTKSVKLPSTKTGRRRLLKLAGLLEADAKNKKGIKFDLEHVAVLAEPKDDGIYRGWTGREFLPDDVVNVDCGTAACAVGLAAISGAFKREGLGYEVIRSCGLFPTFRGVRGFGSVETKFFKITRDESEFLFIAGSYSGPTTGAAGERAVAKRIRAFVAGKNSFRPPHNRPSGIWDMTAVEINRLARATS